MRKRSATLVKISYVRASDQSSDTVVGFNDPDFLQSTMISVIGDHLLALFAIFSLCMRTLLFLGLRQNSDIAIRFSECDGSVTEDRLGNYWGCDGR